jgi:photosystem II stability/assembly factor-like uncharacterized protein
MKTCLRSALSLSACLAICVAFNVRSTVAQSNWSSVRSGASGDLVAVYFTSDKNGWIAGDAGYLASTNDGGASWSKYPLETREDINEIYFRNDNNGYLVAGRVMYITHDGGKAWRPTRLYDTANIKKGTPEFLSIRFAGKKIGLAIGSILEKVGKEDLVVDSLVMRTDDGGDTWTRITVPSKVELYHLDFTDSDHAWIVGDKGLIMASTDGGLNWRVQNSGVAKPIFNVDFRDDNNGYAVGGGGTILRSQNGGSTWEKINAGYTQSLMRVDFADDKNGWIVGYDGTILRSSDRGATWVRQPSKTNQRIYGLFMSKKYGWAVGENGLILKYEK